MDVRRLVDPALPRVRPTARTALPVVVLMLLLSVLLGGGGDVPAGDWRHALLWGALVLLLGATVQDVVRQRALATQPGSADAARAEAVVRSATLSSLIATDVDGMVTMFSTGAERELGYLERDVVGRELTSFLLVTEELREVADELAVPAGFPVLARLAGQRSPSRIWTMLRSDGQRAFMRMAVTELHNEGGCATGYLCVAMDATSSIRSRKALSLAEERWRILVDHLPETTVVMVEEGAGVTVVTGAGRLARRLDGGADRRLQAILDRDAPGTLQRLLDQAFAGQEVSPVHALVDDHEHEFVAGSLPPASGRRRAIIVARDVSEDRRRERILTAAKERAERLFDDAPQGVGLLDPEGVLLRANPALEALLGGDDLVGQPLSLRSFSDGDRTVEEHLHRVRTSLERRAESQWSVRGSDGEELHVVLVSTMLPAAESEPRSADTVLTNVVDVSERYRYERRLAFLAEHDSLTGLANRRRFDERLELHVDDCRRYGARGAVLMLDLDHFKEVNDSLGHAVGDQLLRDVARVLSQRMRSTDLVARLGGDEFAILLPHADRKAAELVAADVVDCIRREARSHRDSRRRVSVSLGGAVVDEKHSGGSELLSAADTAMYVAKNSGRDRYTFLNVSQGR